MAEDTIDMLGDAGRAEMLATSLRELQSKLFQLRLTRVANGHDEDDFIPGVAGVTYGERCGYFIEAQQRLVAAFPGEVVENAKELG